jgi:hypothetical protein
MIPLRRQPQDTMTEPQPDLLMDILLGVLAPLLMAGSITDIQVARLATRQAIDAYTAHGQDQLITVAQIVGFALTALDDLRLSMQPDLSLSMKLRLRGNANALGRAALRNTEALQKSRPPVAEPKDSRTEPAAPAPSQRPEASPPEPDEQQNRLRWAAGMTAVAADLRARPGQAASDQHRSDQLWAEVLTDLAGELRGHGKAGLLRSTSLATG